MALHNTEFHELTCIRDIADQREFIKICQAVGMGFLIMVRNPLLIALIPIAIDPGII